MYRKIQRVQKVLKNAALHSNKFGTNSGISCASGCHLCCLKKDISASPLEFLPMAYYLYKEGKADEIYDKIDALPDNDLCVFFSALGNTGGGCSEYLYRGLICRLFGFATNRDKQGTNRLITCKPIKEQPVYTAITAKQLTKAPVMTEYYMQLAAIDFSLANEQLQINQAVKRALELVMTYYLYRGRRRSA